MTDPTFVRLTNRLTRGCLADVQGSGWSISGLDVKPFPEGQGAGRYVRNNLKNGKLEPASRAEFEDVQESNQAIADAMRSQYPDFDVTPQESVVQDGVQAAQRKLAEKRGDTRSPEERYDEEVRQPRQDRAHGGALPEDIESLKKDELVALAERRGLDKSGTKAELVARLEQSDEGEDSDEE